LQTFQIGALHPGSQQSGDDQHQSRRDQGRQRPDGGLTTTRKFRRATVNELRINCIKAWLINWFNLSVSLLIREIRSPDLFWLKNATGNSCSLQNNSLRKPKKNPPADPAKSQCLDIGGDQPDHIHSQQYRRQDQNPAVITVLDIQIHGPSDDYRIKQGCRRPDKRRQDRDGEIYFFVI